MVSNSPESPANSRTGSPTSSETSRTFADLDERVSRLGNALAERGVGRGDRVATLTTNCIEMVETYLACGRVGAICVPINFRLLADEVTYIAQDSGTTALVVDARLAHSPPARC